MKRQKKRYGSAALVERDINTLLNAIEMEAKEAELCDKDADELFAWCNANDVLRGDEIWRANWHKANEARKRADWLRRQRYNRELRLRHLKETLAVAKTPTFDFIEDKSVTVQPLRV